MSTRVDSIRDGIVAKSIHLLMEAFAQKADSIANVLSASEDGKHSAGVSIKFTIVNDKLYVNLTLRHATKESAEVEASAKIEDPNQPGLPGVEGEQ